MRVYNMKLAIIIGVVVILFVVFILASYIKAPTDRALIVSGLRKNPKFVIGKSALRIPFLQRVDKLELKMISVDVKTKESVPTNEYINVNIDSAVKIKVGSSKEMLEKAASNFLNKNEDYIRNSVGDVLEGNVREIIGQMRLEDIVQDRKMFAEKVQENAAPDMARMGLEIVSFNVQNVTDEGNVIENLGIDRVVSISKSAQISRAESERDIEVAKANATKQANDARIEAETAIAERNNELEIKKQELKRAADVKKAEADAAYEIQQQEQRKTIEITTADANIAKQEKEIELREKEIAVKEKTLDADIRKQAEAEKYATQQKADAQLYQRQKEAEAKQFEIQKQAEAKKAQAEAIAKPLESIDKVTIIDGGSGENGVGTFSGNVPSVLAKTIESIKETTGFDLTEVMKANTYDAKTTKNVNFTGLPEEMSAAAKEPETDGKTE
jgi:flotillin